MTGAASNQVIVKDPYEFFSLLADPSFKPFQEMVETDGLPRFVLHGFVREALFANLRPGKQVKLADRYYYLINCCRSVNELDLGESADFFARELLQLIFISSGTLQAFLKTLLTNYSISEQRTEEKAFQEFKETQKEEGKKLEWRFAPRRQNS